MKQGCLDGCIHKKEIKLKEMQETYEFRCSAFRQYMTENDIKKTCKEFQYKYKVIAPSIEDFIQ